MRADLVALVHRAVDPVAVTVTSSDARIGRGNSGVSIYGGGDRWSVCASAAGRTRADMVAGAERAADLLDRLAAAGIVDGAPLPPQGPTCGVRHPSVTAACERATGHDGDHEAAGVRWPA